MARKNRIVAEDALYHVTARIAHRAFLLADVETKERIVSWMYDIADFSGIEVASWNVMDNHLHIFLHVPTVPEEYWTEPGALPPAARRSMRPAECREPRWAPDGDCPPREAAPRPGAGFALPDDEMARRLRALHADRPDDADRIARRWARMRADGRSAEVDAEKDALCRRMYSVSQYMKTLKQRISEHFNRKLGHAGQLWDGRFRSTLVEKDELAKLYVSSYVEWNAPKAGIARHPGDWRWCSYAAACGSGAYARRARDGYARLFGSWEVARARLEAVFDDRLPEGAGDGGQGAGGQDCARLRMSQIIKRISIASLAFFSRRMSFVEETLAALPRRFPCADGASVRFLSRFDWTEPPRRAA